MFGRLVLLLLVAAPAPDLPQNGRVTPQLEATLAGLPTRPGVYLMRDARGTVLYVGKAQNLRSRVRSYWQRQATSGGSVAGAAGPGDVHRIREVIDKVADLEYTLTDSVSEALLLEANLIKRYQPRFNVRLKDDKSYPYIRITLGDDFPRIERTRKLHNDGSRYFGPYASASSVDEAMNLIRRLFPFRTCTIDIREGERALRRPCLLYHIKRCQGPCIEAVSKEAYRADVAQVELFLEGRQETLVRELRREMEAASGRTDYERAAAMRDKVRAIERTMEDQKMAAFARTELDVLGLARSGNQAAVQVFAVRAGKLVGRDVYVLEAPGGATDDETLAGVRAPVLRPLDVDPPGDPGPAPPGRGRRPGGVPRRPPRAPSAAARPRARREAAPGRPGGPQRSRPPGAGAGTLARRRRQDAGRPRGAGRGPRAGRAAAADRVLRHLDDFQGSETVGSMVVFEDGRPRTGAYRRFRIKDVAGQDDFASHAEMLRRRLYRGKAGEEGSAEEQRWALPDLIVVDGGKGQLAADVAVLRELGLDEIPIAGLAKEREELFLPGRPDPVILPPTSSALYLVQRIRDEAHRFADHLPPRPAPAGRGEERLRRPARRRPEAQARAAASLRLGQARPRGAGRAGRRRAGHRAGAGGADQGDARGVYRAGPAPQACQRAGPVVPVTSRPMRRDRPILILVSSACSPSSSTSSPV